MQAPISETSNKQRLGLMMADTLKIETVNFTNILGTEASRAFSDDFETPFSQYSEQAKREVAVTAVLELIRAKVGAEGGRLSDQMKNLNTYTDYILAAMKGEKPQ